MQYKRSARVGDQIKKDVANIIMLELKDPRLGLITINSVELSDDLRYARVFYTVFGDEKVKKESQKGLDSAKSFIQRELAKRIRIKRIPELTFKYDQTIEKASRIDHLLNQIQNESKLKDE